MRVSGGGEAAEERERQMATLQYDEDDPTDIERTIDQLSGELRVLATAARTRVEELDGEVADLRAKLADAGGAS